MGAGTGALAEYVDADCYWGVEIDDYSVVVASRQFPSHHLSQTLQDAKSLFDTIIALAVIERFKDSVNFLCGLAGYLTTDPNASIVITTPHPAVGWVHGLGANLGRFSHHTNEEHEELLDRQRLASVAQQASLVMVHYHRFLWVDHQLAGYLGVL